MVNLTIRLGKAVGVSGKQQQQQQEQAAISVSTTTTTATATASAKGPSICPHLVGRDLPLLKGVGTVFSEPCALNFVGVKARRRLGDKVHICVRCDFPIAVYGRLIPCEHVFCLTCAKLDPACFLCEERVTRIQKMDVLEGIFICGAPGCLRSFLVRSDFDLHITEAHPQLLHVEHGRLSSPERNVSASGISVPEPQGQSHQSGQQQHQQHADFAPRQSSGTLQVLLPKKDEPQRRLPLKGVRQGVDPQALLARPVPELRLPDQFPHHRGGEQHSNREREADVGRDQQKPRRRTEWDKGPQGDNEMHEGGDPQSNNNRRWEDGSTSKEQPSKGIQPPSYGTPKDQQQKQAVMAALPPPPPPPPPYPPPNYPTAYNQDGNNNNNNNNAFRFGAFHPPPNFNYNGRPPPPMTGGTPRPFFYPPEQYGIMPHLPPPPPPSSKRTKFSGEPEYNNNNSWGNNNPGNFGGYPNWMPPPN